MEMSPKAVAVGVVGLVILLSFIFGLTGYIKSEQSEDAASTSAQKQDQLTNKFDEFRSIAQRVLKIEEQALKDKEHILNLTMNVSLKLQAVKTLHSKLIENVQIMQVDNLNFPEKLDAFRNNTSFAFSEINQDVDLLTETIDDLHLSLNNSGEVITIRNLTEEQRSKEYKAQLNKTITGFKTEMRKTVESIDIASTNLDSVEGKLNATKEQFEENKAILTNQSEKLNTSIKSLNSKTAALNSSDSVEEQITATPFVPTTSEIETSGGYGTTATIEGSGGAVTTTIAEVVTTTGEVTVSATTISPEETLSLLEAEMNSTKEKIKPLDNTMNDFIHGTYKETFDQIAVATKRLNDRDSDEVWMHGLNGYLYRIIETNQTWETAKTTCEDNGGYLAHKGITDFVVRWRLTNIAIADSTQPYWIGLNYKSDEGNWAWIDNTVAGEGAVWAPGEPNDASYDCGAVTGGESLYKSHDADCSQSYSSLCEKECC